MIMNTSTFQPIEARPAPVRTDGAVAWMRSNLFHDLPTTLATLILGGLLLWMLPSLFQWAIGTAVWMPDLKSCDAEGAGACWGVIGEKYKVIFLGRYPVEEAWRPIVATLLMIGLLIISCIRAFWNRSLLAYWVVVLGLFFVLRHGGVAGMSVVTTDRWGGLPLTIMLSTLSIVASFPLGLLVALGRRSNMPAIRTLCVVFVELIRGVPLISVLFMASFMFPLFMPAGTTIDVLVRVLVGITLFMSAYTAETIRGGLQAIPKGQVEAAATLGLSYWQTQRKIVLPQALAMVVPGLMNNFISNFKDTSLVTIVSMYELLGALGLALSGDPEWHPFILEGYLFVALVYFAFCFSMSRYSRWVEKQVNKGKQR
jgi:general L-amino acid transport system permease protein